MISEQYRPLQDDTERQRWDELLHYAFAGEKDQQQQEQLQQAYPLPALVEPRGYFKNNQMVSACAVLPFEANLRGSKVPVAGLGAVTTAPEMRRKGLCRQMLLCWLEEVRKRNMYLSALWPFSRSFYRRLGWITATEYSQFEFSPSDLAEIPQNFDDHTGQLRPMQAHETDSVNDIYDDWASRYDLTITRCPDWWQRTILTQPRSRVYTYLHENGDGCADGYVIYALVRTNGWDRRMSVSDIAYSDASAYRSMLRFIYGHQPQANEVRISRPADDPLFLWLSGGTVKRQKGVMMRVVDVMRALESLRYPEGLSVSLVIQVSDEFASWNNAMYLLQIEGGRGRVRSYTRDRDGDWDVSLDIQSFSQLYAGYLNPEELRLRGGLTVAADSNILDLLGEVFPERNSFMMEDF